VVPNLYRQFVIFVFDLKGSTLKKINNVYRYKHKQFKGQIGIELMVKFLTKYQP
jgi:hypothetical protein